MGSRRRGPGLRHRLQRRLLGWLGHSPQPSPGPEPLNFAVAVDAEPHLVAYIPGGAQDWILDFLWRDLRDGMARQVLTGLTLGCAATPAELAEQMAGRNAYVLVMFQGHLPRLLREGVPPERVLLYVTHVRLGLALPALQQLHALLVLNDFERALVEMQGVAPCKVHRFPAGYDPRLFHPPEAGHQRSMDVVFVGRYQSMEQNPYYHRRKRFAFQVELANRLVEQGQSVTILGPGWQNCCEPLDPRVQRLDRAHASYGEVYRQARLVCSVAAQEGGPVSFLEGLACGCLMLSTPTGFAGDWVSGWDGVQLLPLTAAVEDWADAVERCLRLGLTQEASLSARRQAYLEPARFTSLAQRLIRICGVPSVPMVEG